MRYMPAAEAFFRIRVPYRTGLDWLFSGRLRGRRQGKHWEVEIGSLEALERELGLLASEGLPGE